MHTYRLRQGAKIVGYQRLEGSTEFYSKDSFWWNGKAIEYDVRDMFSGLKDKNDRPLYAHDIITLRFSNPLRKNRNVRLVEQEGKIAFVDLEKGYSEGMELLGKVKSITFVSFTFINQAAVFGIGEN